MLAFSVTTDLCRLTIPSPVASRRQNPALLRCHAPIFCEQCNNSWLLIGSGCYVWVPIDLEGKTQLRGIPPEGAVIGGYERSNPTHVARARHEGHWEVGKLNAWARIGYSYHGKEYEADTGEVLVARGGQVTL